MRTKACIFLLVGIASFGSARGDIVLNAPGVPVGSQVVTKVPFRNDVLLSGSYKFVFSGIEAKGNTLGAPGSSGTQGNGGIVLLKASVSDDQPGSPSAHAVQITFRDQQDLNTSPLKTLFISPAAVFRADQTPIQVKVVWQGEGNAHKPNGTFNILGEYQKDPPVPTGSLSFAVGDYLLTASNPFPEGVARINRE